MEIREESVTCGMRSAHGRRRRTALRAPAPLRFANRIKIKIKIVFVIS